MRHRSSDRPSSAHLATQTPRARHRTATAGKDRGGRWGLGVAVLALVTGFVLAAPVVSGSGSHSETALDASAAVDSPVVMGLDGRPTSSTFASASARLALDDDGDVRVESSASRSGREELPAAPPATTPVPTPAPAPVAAPAPPPAVVPAQDPAPPAPTAAAPARPSPSTPPVAPAPRPTLAGKPAPPPPAAPPPAAPAQLDRAGQVLALVNQERAAAGCAPLTADRGLAAVATAHSEDMRDRSFFGHVNPDGASPFDRADAAGVSARAENIARGQSGPAAVMESWMDSPGHRANILDCGLRRLGVGIADGGSGPWWTQLFG